MRFAGWTKAAAIGLCLAAGTLPATAALARPAAPDQAPVVLAAAELRKLGFQVLAAGRPDAALKIADALLVRDATDPVAHILKSRALRDMGRYRQAQAAGRDAYAAARSDNHKFAAAMATAQALASGSKRTTAQLWLRRAVQAAPSDQARAVAVRDFNYVRSRNPLSFSVDVFANPSSNVNGGSSNTTTEILGQPFPLSGDAQALSGFTWGGGVTARLLRPESTRGQTEFRLSASARFNALSAAAQALAPAATGSDYNFAALEMGVSRQIKGQDARNAYSLGATLGRNWYGGAVLSDYLRLDASASRGFSRRSAGQVAVYAERQERRDNAANSATVLGITGALVRVAGNGDRLRFSLGLRDTGSGSTAIAHQAISAGIGWEKSRPLGPTTLSAGLGLESRNYAVFPFSASGRQDLKITATVNLGLPKLEVWGFSPVVTLSASQTESNVGRFDSQDFGLSVGIRSNF